LDFSIEDGALVHFKRLDITRQHPMGRGASATLLMRRF
jgi:hypothetical protein